jgi:hypothetical protein
MGKSAASPTLEGRNPFSAELRFAATDKVSDPRSEGASRERSAGEIPRVSATSLEARKTEKRSSRAIVDKVGPSQPTTSLKAPRRASVRQAHST